MASNSKVAGGYTMKLFGAPYQFTEDVDPRNTDINNVVGYNYLTKFLSEAPLLTIIPGIPRYLPGDHSKSESALALYDMVESGNKFGMNEFIKEKAGFTDDHFRLYDFSVAYTEYMDYVNALCRAGAGFLELNTILNIGQGRTKSSYEANLVNFDWKQYTWIDKNKNSKKITGRKDKKGSTANSDIGNKIETDSSGEIDLASILDQRHYVQFYCDPTSSDPGDSFSNQSTESKLKSIFGTGSDWMKDLGFMMQSGGGSAAQFEQFATESMDSIMDYIGNATSQSGIEMLSPISRILNLGGNVLKGENIVIPDIYNASTFDKNYTARILLRSPYGNKLSYFLDIFVPLMHLLALVVPRATSANTYKSPFLVKANISGGWNVCLGLCTGLQVTRTPESKSIDGLPTEVEVTLTIQDLYSDLTLSRAADVKSFLSNGSLIEYLANNCGISLSSPNFDKKIDLVMNSAWNAVTDIPSNFGSAAQDIIAQNTALFRLR